MNEEKCTEVGPDCPADGSSLGYPPNLVVSIIFMGVFGTSLVCHLVQGWRAKTWTFMIAMCLGSNAEVIGYLGRVFMHSNPYRLSTLVLIFLFTQRMLKLSQISSSNHLPHSRSCLLCCWTLSLSFKAVRITFNTSMAISDNR